VLSGEGDLIINIINLIMPHTIMMNVAISITPKRAIMAAMMASSDPNDKKYTTSIETGNRR